MCVFEALHGMLKKCEVLKGPQLDKAQSNSEEKKKIEKKLPLDLVSKPHNLLIRQRGFLNSLHIFYPLRIGLSEYI